VLKNFKEVTTHHWFSATNVDVKHLEVTKLIENSFGLLC
jgi:hypothetical protein